MTGVRASNRAGSDAHADGAGPEHDYDPEGVKPDEEPLDEPDDGDEQ